MYAKGSQLDQITVEHVLNQDPTKPARPRYASVEALAEDVERYLDNRPVLARGDALPYRLKKFIRRHRLALTTAAAVVAMRSHSWSRRLGSQRLLNAANAVRSQLYLF